MDSANLAFNQILNSKIGTTTDKATVDTLFGRHKGLYEHVHMPAKVYPTLAADKVLTASDAGTWTYGSLTAIIPAADAPAVPYDVHWINISDMNTNGIYELELYYADNDALDNPVLVGSVRVTRNAGITSRDNVFTQGPVIPANKVLAGKVAHSTAALATVTFSVHYHEYTVATQEVDYDYIC